MDTDEKARIRRELVRLTSMPGWRYVRKVALDIMNAAVEKSLTEDDKSKAEVYRYDARAARKVFAELFNIVEKNLSEIDTTADWDHFSDIGADFTNSDTISD
jgi:hypothetical protein